VTDRKAIARPRSAARCSASLQQVEQCLGFLQNRRFEETIKGRLCIVPQRGGGRRATHGDLGSEPRKRIVDEETSMTITQIVPTARSGDTSKIVSAWRRTS
jgi:hypothetical protein